MNEKQLLTAQQWLVSDQHPHGEWGKCEIKDPTSDPRDFAVSKLKPNMFISSQAALALQATGYGDPNPNEAFFRWIANLRDNATGFWTSAGGAQMPMGDQDQRGWSEIPNYRHTAKALDLYLLRNEFTSGDAQVLHKLLETQLADGSFPQHPALRSDLWSTAYTMNLLIRAQHEEHLTKAIPLGSTRMEWGSKLRTALDRARGWIVANAIAGLWEIPGKDPMFVSRAVLAEIGADLAMHRPDIAAQAASKIFVVGDEHSGQTLWAMLLVLECLPAALKRDVEAALKKWTELRVVQNTYEMACSVRAFYLKDKVNLTSSLLRKSSGHESLMDQWASWQSSETHSWTRPATSSAKIDIAVITVRDDEFKAVLHYFPPGGDFPGARRTYAISEVASVDGKPYRIALLKSHEQGHGAAQSAASDVIVDLEPSWLLVVGIAGAVPDYEYSLGDVVIATRVIDFSVTAALEGGRTELVTKGAPAHKAAQDLAARIPALRTRLGSWNSATNLGMTRPSVSLDEDLFYGDAEWRRKVKSTLEYRFGPGDNAPPTDPVAIGVSIASANMLVKDSALIQEWMAHARDIKAVEMELPGVFEAARDQRGDRPVLAIRGISDVIGYRRSPEWTAFACRSAAAFAHALVVSGAIPDLG